ncbi:sialate O-acetylesterase [Niabella insulamsoli]|uniref:sialate O-acetylesterase n=1 Tax=Niabella insulamsoli TaxID=3144874 RepID=UPI0031FD67DF
MRYLLLASVIIVCSLQSNGTIWLPHIFASNMVIQRDQPIAIWGTSNANEKITVSLGEQVATALSNQQGKWHITLKPMPWGGPYDCTISAHEEKRILHNILIGDVWICSGQSNMEMPVSGWSHVNNAEKEISDANFPKIRLFTVEKATSFMPKTDLAGGTWLVCNSTNIPPFSAVAYFFGRKIHLDTRIPIGLISTNWGGTNIQAWTSWKTLSTFDGYKHLNTKEMNKTLAEQEQRRKAYDQALAADPGSEENWHQNNSISGWTKIQMPKLWESSPIGQTDGIIYFKKFFTLRNISATQNISLHLGPIDDADSTYINGKLVGTNNTWNKSRVYSVPKAWLKEGENIITIKITDGGAQGGMAGTATDLFLSLGDKKISLAGEWYYQPAVVSKTYHLLENGPNAFPSQLFNAMISPLTAVKIKGVIWYQGEANVDEAARYQKLFPAMISDWRNAWSYDFPFIWVQLANYLERRQEPAASPWAELRAAQHQALSMKNTGEAVAIDIGDANDIHPHNKQDVGWRLALAAEKIAYNQKIISSGPIFTSSKVEDNVVVLSFEQVAEGLVIKDKKLAGFAIAGADRRFVWADARVSGNQVIVSSPSVEHPVAVRYAWADNPEAGLYNREMLPASPFRTDNWPLSTENKKVY